MAKKKPTARASQSAAKSATKIESIRHRDKRKNIPTEELRDFVTEDEHAPKSMLYPRDPSLDPQLVWKGKDEQDQADLAVPIVPIYIQEKIHPQAIIDALPRIEKPGDDQLNLFADFNGGPADFAQKVEFYQHDQNWANRLILGDSLLVMTSLAEKEGLKGKVQTIYFDPPYGIRFGSNWQVSTRKRDVKDGKAEDATRQPEQIRAFRDTWQLGIHSYLAYLRDRLVAARELLTETGSIFVQIGDENVHLVRSVMDEVFGSENFISLIVVKKLSGVDSTYLPSTSDFLLLYAKDADHMKYRPVMVSKLEETEGADRYDQVLLESGTSRSLSPAERSGDQALPPNARRFRMDNIVGAEFRPDTTVPFEYKGKRFHPGNSSHWKTSIAGMTRLGIAHRLMATSGGMLAYVRMLDDFPAKTVGNIWDDISGSIQSRSDPKVYVVQTSTALIQRCLLMTSDPGDLVLDPTCGSGTTAYVAEQWGRRWITCDTSRVALALARTRLMAAKYPYYVLADNVAVSLRETNPLAERADHTADIKKGFLYKRVPHVTLKSIANNSDIREGMTREQIDAAIARHAETETLYDQPQENNKLIRVCGPFTVESLSPHRTISAQEKKQRAEVGRGGLKMKVIGPDNFGHMVIENLRKAGVQNTRKGERLKFDSLDPYPGEWIHAQGTYSESGTPYSVPSTEYSVPSMKDHKTDHAPATRRVAVCIGPEHGTVGAMLIKEAAREAVKGVGFDVLVVCGFAFDPSVSEEAKRYGKLVVLPTKMNPDLAMGDELLKKTGAGNLFMVFGDPDVEIKKQKDGQFVVEIHGLDVYDPTTGAIRSSSTDDIACWFIDTDYDEDSFFVRHAYFTGADEPYDKLKRALKAEIDEAAWSALYSTTSRPFPMPGKKGKIAVKVINHYGDEVLKVYDLQSPA